MKKKHKIALAVLLFLIAGVTVFGLGLTNAYYRQTVTGAATGKTSDYEGEISVVSETHVITPAANVAVDEIRFYVKNYTGADDNPTNTSEVFLSYKLTFTLPTWGTGCTNPISYGLVSVNQSNNEETTVQLDSSNATGTINFEHATLEKDYYILRLYWNMDHNDVPCYAGKSGSVGIAANIFQNPTIYGSL